MTRQQRASGSSGIGPILRPPFRPVLGSGLDGLASPSISGSFVPSGVGLWFSVSSVPSVFWVFISVSVCVLGSAVSVTFVSRLVSADTGSRLGSRFADPSPGSRFGLALFSLGLGVQLASSWISLSSLGRLCRTILSYSSSSPK